MSAAVHLSWAEAQQAALVGVQWKLRALAYGHRHRWAYDGGDSWTRNIESAASELALAKHLGVFWADSGGPNPAGDVGREQVRHTERTDGRLIVHPEDKDNARYWLVTGKLPDFVVVGCLLGADAKRDDYWTDPGTGRPAYFVPQSALAQA